MGSKKKKDQNPLDMPTAPSMTPPEACKKCDGTRFQQHGDKMICKVCKTSH